MIVGTAGHVDHGKTSLVRALTGVDTDRLKEEKARGITIDLGFAYMPGANGETIGFVDVPGHERLIRTMVAGAAGIDFALLVVAGDEGIKPQTREHLDILHILGLPRGLIVVTKSDRIDAARRIGVAREIAAVVVGTGLADAETMFVSVVSGEGIGDLRQRLTDAAATARPREEDGVFRLSVDRAFTLAGVGTVVTGTALGGRVRAGDEVTIMPGGRKARVRSLHAQNRESLEGLVGDRCALALSGPGVARGSTPRGTWICGEAEPGETIRFDADIRLLPGGARGLAQWTPVHLHSGASDVSARVTVLADQPLQPGHAGLAQVVLDYPLPLRHGDRFVLRDQNARHTIGGGRVIDPRAPLRKRRAPERLARLGALGMNDAGSALTSLLDLSPGFEDATAFLSDRGIDDARGKALLESLGLLTMRVGAATFTFAEDRWAALRTTTLASLAQFHIDHPEFPGIAGERLRLTSLPILAKPLFAAVRDRLLAEKAIAAQGHWVHLPQHVAQLSAEDRRLETLMMPLMAAEKYRPPRVRDIGTTLAVPETTIRRACKALTRVGSFIELAPDHFFTRATVVEMASIAQDLTRISATGLFTAADFRDRVNNGRKVAIQILETFDRHGLTHRDGDLRRVVKSPDLIFGASPTDSAEPKSPVP